MVFKNTKDTKESYKMNIYILKRSLQLRLAALSSLKLLIQHVNLAPESPGRLRTLKLESIMKIKD